MISVRKWPLWVSALVAVAVVLSFVLLAVRAGGATSSSSCSKTDDGTNETVTCPSTRITVTKTPAPGPTTTVFVTVPPTSADPVTTPPTSTPPPATSASPTPTPTPSPTGTTPPSALTSGQQINSSNVGYKAWVGPEGQTCTDATLKVYTTRVTASSLGGSATCAWFKKGVTFDQNATINGSRFDTSIDTNGHTVNLGFDNIDTVAVEDIAVHGEGTYNLFRSSVSGSSDGLRFDGDSVIENLITVKAASHLDHNDGIQAYQSDSGGAILRNNINGKPVNAKDVNLATGNSALFLADNSKGNADIEGNYFSGGGDCVNLNESMIYTHFDNNIVVAGSYGNDAVDTANSVKGAFPDWENNRLSNGTPIEVP